MFIMIKVIFSSCNRMTTGCIWPSPGAHYLFFGVNTGGDKLQVSRKPCQADHEPLPLPGRHLFGVGALGARLGVCAHLLRGHIRLVGSTPAPTGLCQGCVRAPISGGPPRGQQSEV